MVDSSSLKDNPLLATSGLPDFAAIRPEHVVPAVQHLVHDATEKLTEIEQHLQPTWEGSLGKLETLDPPFEYGWKPVGHLFGVLNSDELRAAYETVLPEVVQFGLRASQSEPIYQTLKQLRQGAEWSKLSEAQQRIVTDRIKGAELSGIALTGEKRERFNAIEQELSQLSTEFSNHVLDATKAFSLDITDSADAEGWPSTLRNLAAKSWNGAHPDAVEKATPAQGPWRITLEPPLFTPFMEHCRNGALRETLYRAFVTRASSGELNNDLLIVRFLALRREKALLLGYHNFAEVSLARKMAPSVEAIRKMFTDLRSAAWDAAARDLDDIRALRAEHGVTEPLNVWDVAFWAERLREERYAYTDDELRPYFPFERVLAGLFQLLERLFDVKIHQQTDVSVWHPDVRFYRVHDASGTHIASFYLDPYSRPENKRGGAWMDDCLGRRTTGGHLQLPVAHLVCNQTPPHGDTPSLMSFREVETLFHEMGHGLQHMLTKVDFADCAGINGVEWDAVELPSQFMENWCYHRPTLLSLTGHYQTGEPLPESLFEKIRAAKNFRAGSMTLRQLLFGMTDITLHSDYDPSSSETPHQVNQRLSKQTSVLPLLPEDRSLCSFQHIFSGGYAAGYYSYKWAEILSADAFSAFEEAGLDNPQAIHETGRRFRDTVLALGGSRHPMEVFREFRGREPKVDALLRHSGLGN
ncbi:M3 family metallopeptidase [Schlesneria paludicola]|uniref:M3 family metallopeptidase n=1 Tax=Schlesneria paludicola TaxID=360056 RepID=UPI00029B29C9|nr:M3 family metallopeptidase [Schlesneria paludicola]